MPNEGHITLRLPAAVLERADALVPTLADNAALSALLGKVSRSDVLRLAVVHGLAQLEDNPAGVVVAELERATGKAGKGKRK